MPGERADFVYVLRQGRVKLSVLAESGKETAIDIIEPGEIFGEFALVDESLRSNMTQALDDVMIWVFDKRDFAHLLVETKLAMNYIRLVGDRRRRMEKKLSDITSKDVTARVCELLHELSVSTSEIDEAAPVPRAAHALRRCQPDRGLATDHDIRPQQIGAQRNHRARARLDPRQAPERPPDIRRLDPGRRPSSFFLLLSVG